MFFSSGHTNYCVAMDTDNNEDSNAVRNFAIGLRGLARASSVYPNIAHQVVNLAKELPIPPQCTDSKLCKLSFVFEYEYV